MSKMADTILDFNVVDDFSFDKICRLCLSDVGPMLSLSELVLPGMTSRKRNPIRRADKVFYSVCVLIPKIEKEDLPCQICQKCDNLINEYYNFKERCAAVDHKLHGLAKRRRELHNAKFKELYQTTNISTPKETISKSDTRKKSMDLNVIKPCSKLKASKYYKSKFILESVMKPADFRFVSRPTPPTNPRIDGNNEATLESVIVGDSPFVDSKDEDALDPLAIRLEDIKNTALNTYNNKSKGCRKDVNTESFLLMEGESAAVGLLTRGSTDSRRVVSRTFVSKETRTPSSSPNFDVLACEINLHCEMRREDCTINDIFSRNVMSIDTIKLLDFDNRFVPCISNLDVPTPVPKECVDVSSTPVQRDKITSPNKTNPVEKVQRRSPLCESKLIVPKLKLKLEHPPKESTKSPQVPRYTYSRRCSNLREASSSNSEQPTASQPSTEQTTLSIVDLCAEVSSDSERQGKTEEKTSSVPNHSTEVSSNSEELAASTKVRVPDVCAQVSLKEEPRKGQPPAGDKTASKTVTAKYQSPAEPSRVCVECSETFESYSALVTHIRTHNAVIKIVSCDLCDKTFKSDVLLASHVYMRHKSKGDRSSLCHICGAVLEDRRTLDHHMNKHLGRKDYLCDTCGAGYYNRSDLAYHIRRKHLEAGRPKLRCRHCDVELSGPESMRRHLSLHTHPPTEKCPLCPKMFSRRQQVERHLRSHTGETPYVCEVCKRGFTIKWNYTQHMRLHTKVKPYVCGVCGRAFTHNVSRRSHMRRHEGGGGGRGGKMRRVGTRVRELPLPVT